MVKKVLNIILFIFVLMFANIVSVKATKLDMKDITLECIYSDGGQYTSEYSVGYSDDKKEGFIINRTSYPLQGTSNNESNQGSGSLFLNQMENKMQCHKKLWTSVDSREEGKGTRYYKFGSKIVINKDIHIETSWYCSFFPCVELAKGLAIVDQESYNLVSERYIFKGDTPDPNTIIYYVKDVKEELKQAAGINQYISVLVYDNIILMEKDDRITRLDGDYSDFDGVTRNSKNELSKELPNEIYINSPEPLQTTSSNATVGYSFKNGQKTYSISKTDDSTHTNKYVLTDLEECKDGKKRGSDGKCVSNINDALCTQILPNTSKQLSKVIKWTQILVPVLLIVLTALDIGKIVISGNIDEELPKRRKIITIRFVVVLVFFFLPVFVRLITGWLINSGAQDTKTIQYIDCLFK